MYATLECLIESIILYTLYFKKMNSNYTRNERYNHTNNSLLTNEKQNIQFELTIYTKKCRFQYNYFSWKKKDIQSQQILAWNPTDVMSEIWQTPVCFFTITFFLVVDENSLDIRHLHESRRHFDGSLSYSGEHLYQNFVDC